MSSTPKDTLFQVDSIPEDFVFSERVVEVFDDMLDRSIPFYKEVIHSTAKLLDSFLKPRDMIVDLGCATGSTLLELCRVLDQKDLRYLGVDNSSAMLEKASLKAELFTKKNQIVFRNKDIMELEAPGTGAFLLNYTLQFIRPVKRENFLKHLYSNLRPGGILILSEKQISHDPILNRKYIDIYHDFKKSRGYSELEIAKKREALENILIPFSIHENQTMLKNAGFTAVEPFFQWFNFASFIAVKAE